MNTHLEPQHHSPLVTIKPGAFSSAKPVKSMKTHVKWSEGHFRTIESSFWHITCSNSRSCQSLTSFTDPSCHYDYLHTNTFTKQSTSTQAFLALSPPIPTKRISHYHSHTFGWLFSCRKYYGGRTAVKKSETRNDFAWADDEVELLLNIWRTEMTLFLFFHHSRL